MLPQAYLQLSTHCSGQCIINQSNPVGRMEIVPESTRRVQPRLRAATPTTVPLSILDATCAEIATCGAVWYLDASTQPQALRPRDFAVSLSETLNNFPQWCGKVEFVKYEHPTADHTKRHGRVTVTYGTATDPGVEFTTARCTKSISEVVADAEDRRVSKQWSVSHLNAFDFIPKTRLAPRSAKDDAPCITCQVTTFSCGGIAIAVGLTHSLSDAQGLATFMRCWSSIHKSGGEMALNLQPLFAPHLLDVSVPGIDNLNPDPDLLRLARSLPCNRYDTHLESGGPSWSLHPTPDEIDSQQLSPGDPQPFEDWDLCLPVSSYILHFSCEEIEAIWQAACINRPVSRHDAILAHVWILINRARFPYSSSSNVSDQRVHLDVSFGVRKRLAPPLPSEFLGSPIMVANVELPISMLIAQDMSSSSILLATTANKIHDTLAQFTTEAVTALLHDAAHEPCAQRLWQSFLGRKHTILTSWVHLDLYKSIDFGFGSGAVRFVQPMILPFDGIVEIMEARPGLGEERHETRRHWTEDGVDVYIFLESAAAARLLEDSLLRAYDKSRHKS